MVDSVHSGYKQDLTDIVFGTPITTLANNTWSVLSDVVNNDANKYLFSDFILTLGTLAGAPTTLTIPIYLIPLVDGATNPVWEASGTVDSEVNESYFVGSFTLVDTTGQGEYVLRNVSLPPGKFKMGIRNTCGQAFVGATLEYRPWQYASA